MAIRAWLLLFLASPAFATMDLCHFSALAADADDAADAHAAPTYSQLLQSPAARELTADAIARMVESGDPYGVPEVPGADTLSLRRQLRQFREILEARGWNTPARRNELLDRLRGRIAELAQARSAEQLAIRRTATDILLPIPAPARVEPIPGRPELLVLTKQPRELRVLDLDTGGLRSLNLNDDYFSEARPTADGTQLILGKMNGQLGVVPFDGKQLDWTNARNIGAELRALKKTSVRRLVSLGGNGPEGERIVAVTRDRFPEYVFSLRTNERFLLGYEALGVKKEGIINWGRTGNGEQLYFLHRRVDNLTLDILVANLGPTGSLTLDKAATQRTGTKDATSILVWPDRSPTPLISTLSEVTAYVPGMASGTVFLKTAPREQIVAMDASPTHAFTLMQSENAERQWLEATALRNGQSQGRIDLKGAKTTGLKVLPDGRIYLRQSDGGPRLIDPSSRLELTP